MVIRQEGETLRRYLHLSTGNYHVGTSHIYTDLALFTADEQMAEDATDLFNLLTGYSLKEDWHKFLVAPQTLRSGLLRHIHKCVHHHSAEHPSHIILIINNLVDSQMIRALYEASNKGVKIEIIVRGVCCLRPGLKGFSENITVKSIVGRFLEHSRVYYFKHHDKSEIFIGSADLMNRNLSRRVEVVFPLENAEVKERVRNIVQYMLDDNVKSRYLDKDGNYTRPHLKEDAPVIDAQSIFMQHAIDTNNGEFEG
jgi:polyphosphate kinase